MSTTSPRPPIPANRFLALLLAPVFMALIAVTVVNVGLDAISTSFDASSQALQWVLAGYALAFGLLLVPSGRLGDATGHKRLFLLGLTLFSLGGTLAGLAPDIVSLNLARLLQGIGSGLLNPQTFAIIQQHFHGAARARAFASMGATVAVAAATGPVLGGALIGLFGDEWGWRWMFLINLPVGLVVIFLGQRWLPDDHVRSSHRPYLDPAGAALLAAAVLSIMLPFFYRSHWWMWLGIPLGVVLIFVFVAWERRVKTSGKPPMVDIAIFKDVAFRNGVTIISVYFIGSTSIWVTVALFLQMGTGHTALQAALVGLPSAVASAIFSQVAGRYVLTLGRRLVIIALASTIVGLTGMALVAIPVAQGAASYLWMMVPGVFIGIGQGMTTSPNTTLTLKAVAPEYAGVASGILSLGQRIGSSIGAGIVPGILFGAVESGAGWLRGFILATSVIVATTFIALLMSVADRRREVNNGA